LDSVIVLGVNTPIGLAILRDLSEHGYHTIGIGAQHCIGHASTHCHQSISRAASPALLIEQLLSLSRKFTGASLIAVSESDIDLLNQHREILSETLNLLIPSASAMAIVLDKQQTIEHAQQLDISCPRTWSLSGIEELEAIQEQLTYPVVLKWADPLQIQQKLIKHQLPLHKLQFAFDYEELVELLALYEVIECYPMIQRYYHGVGLGQFFLCKDGEVHMEFQHIREHEWPPEGGTSTRCRSLSLEHHQDCMNKSKALLKRINWQGVAMVEYRYCEVRQQYILMEINGRFWGSLALAYHSKVMFASNLVRLFSGQETSTSTSYRGVRAIYMIPELKRLFRVIWQPTKIRDPMFKTSVPRELISLAASYISPRCHYFLFSWRDPKPFFRDVLNGLKKIMT